MLSFDTLPAVAQTKLTLSPACTITVRIGVLLLLLVLLLLWSPALTTAAADVSKNRMKIEQQ